MSLQNRLAQLWDVFSIRNRVHGPGYKPEPISGKLRNRVLMLYVDVVTGQMVSGQWAHPENNAQQFWAEMQHALRVAYGEFKLSNVQTEGPAQDAVAFVQRCTTSQFFDFIEASFKVPVAWRIFGDENGFVDALNSVFRLENAPYQVTPGVTRQQPATSPGPVPRGIETVRVSYPRVVRVDDQVAHTEAVMPALSALSDPVYAAADDEFRKALDDYRRGDFEDCLGKCGSAFESVLKVLATKNRITPQSGRDTAGHLIPPVLAKSTLDAATFQEPIMLVARMRNRLSSSHGGGAKVRKVERHVAQFAVTATAAAIILLVQDMGS